MRKLPLLVPDFAMSRLRGWRDGRRPTPLAVAALLSVTACARQDLKSELDRTRSWTATTGLAADRRSANAINGAVARQIADRAAQARSKVQQSLIELAETDSERTAARVVLDSLDEGLAHLRMIAP